jgi:Asp-tRNA(Asn)/Glu-tRNA(Gln) amidotransferase A subunit family amidase
MAFEMARSLSHERLQDDAHLSDRLREQLARGSAIQGEDHAGFLELAQVVRHRIDALFDSFDVLLAPSATGEAPLLADGTGDPIFCRGWTLLGLPCVHLPFARGHRGLPLGLQIVGRFGQDHRLMAHAEWVHERLTR